MKKITVFIYIILALTFAVFSCQTVAYAQQIDKITRRCPSPNGSVYGSNLVTALGDITYTPCPTRTSIFTGLVDFSGATVTGIGGTISGGTNNFLAVFTGSTTVAASPLSYNGTTYVFNQTAGFAADAFRLEQKSSNAGAGLFSVGNLTGGTPSILINETARTVTIAAATFTQTGVTSYALNRTITTAGTTGNQTINKPNGSVNIAAGGSSIVITNNTVTSSSLVNAVANTADATCSVKNVVPTANTVTITMTANCTAETRVAFWVWN